MCKIDLQQWGVRSCPSLGSRQLNSWLSKVRVLGFDHSRVTTPNTFMDNSDYRASHWIDQGFVLLSKLIDAQSCFIPPLFTWLILMKIYYPKYISVSDSKKTKKLPRLTAKKIKQTHILMFSTVKIRSLPLNIWCIHKYCTTIITL